jgi:hypothetical protein
MSQKINPINNKLGVLRVWNYNFQKYGKTFKGYNKSIRPKNYSSIYLNRVIQQNNSIIESIEFLQSSHHVSIKLFIFKLNVKDFKLKIQECLNVISYWIKCPIKILVYQKNTLMNSSFLINNYIFYLFFIRSTPIKQILQLLYSILKKQSSQTVLLYTTKGIQLAKFKGFKIEVTGCFESSRSQMSKTLKCNFGSITLTKLNGYVNYSNEHFFTKFGSCGIKLWLFYDLL